MQNRYAGDVGDFGKFGLLRCLSATDFKIGVNWYFTPDETHNDDGKHTAYLRKPEYCQCDDTLLEELGKVVNSIREVRAIEEANLLTNAVYYRKTLFTPKNAGQDYRQNWHHQALLKLADCDLVFCDPDIGIKANHVAQGSKQSIRYVFMGELEDYINRGQSVLVYSQRGRRKEADYLEHFRALFALPPFSKIKIKVLKFSRGTIRDYLLFMQPQHENVLTVAVSNFLRGNWSRHFTQLDFKRDTVLVRQM